MADQDQMVTPAQYTPVGAQPSAPPTPAPPVPQQSVPAPGLPATSSLQNAPGYSMFGGSNWANHLMLLGGAITDANNARVAGGFLANPSGGFSSGLAQGLKDSVGFDSKLLGGEQQAKNLAASDLENTGRGLDNTGKQIGLSQTIANYNGVTAPVYGLPMLGMDGKPLRDKAGNLVFSPSGDGSSSSGATSSDTSATSDTAPHDMSLKEDLRSRILAKSITANGVDGIIPPNLVYSVIQRESQWNPNAAAPAVGPDGKPTNSTALGLGQIVKSTAENPGYGVAPVSYDALKDAQTNANFTVSYLKGVGASLGVVTAADWNNPAKVAAVLQRYHGPTDAFGTSPTDYAQQVIRGMAARNGHVDTSGIPSPATAASNQGPAPGFSPDGHPLAAGTWDASAVKAAPSGNPPANQFAGPGAPSAPPAGGASSDAPAPSPAPVGNAPAPSAPPAPRPLAPAQIPADAITLTRAYIANRLPMSAMTPDQATAVGNQLIRMGMTSLGTPLLEYGMAGPKAAATKAAQEHWAPSTQNGVAGATNSVTGEFKPTVTGAGRMFTDPAGNIWQSVPGGGPPLLIQTADNAGIAARSSAEAQGGATGKNAALTAAKMVDLGQSSDAAIGNIDYGMSQLHKAQQGGIPSGYFAPWLATAAAAGKSIGLDLKGLGIDAAAVGNVQSAEKTLAVVSGAILQQAIGKDSAITDAKIEHFIHAQPDIATDPAALDRVLNWARSQFVYSREMAIDAMKHADQQTGMIPPGWQAGYYARKGAFAPIFDPAATNNQGEKGEMVQPTGSGPAADAPKPPAASAQFKEGQQAVGPNGQTLTYHKATGWR